MVCNFEAFTETWESRAMLLTLPPPSEDSSLRTIHPRNLLDDSREKWLEAEGADLDKRDESAMQFDKRLKMLMLRAKHEAREVCGDFPQSEFHEPKDP
ncbi:BTB/POZ domain-containing protein [Platanthera zijinensis]|uniref:BTB/POZ domain-containing protein n=1 Tax=Platanthera zijinensis TaxID=2320716 RepID=A0AAP0G735_9ASPA